MKITYGAVLPLPPEQAFDFVSDPASWPTFFESMESAEALQGWGSPGGKARMVSKFLGRSLVSELELVEWDRPHGFRYTARTPGRPDMDNVRTFDAVPGGTRLSGTTSAKARRAVGGVSDLISGLALHRVFKRAMKELPGEAIKATRGAD